MWPLVCMHVFFSEIQTTVSGPYACLFFASFACIDCSSMRGPYHHPQFAHGAWDSGRLICLRLHSFWVAGGMWMWVDWLQNPCWPLLAVASRISVWFQSPLFHKQQYAIVPHLTKSGCEILVCTIIELFPHCWSFRLFLYFFWSWIESKIKDQRKV